MPSRFRQRLLLLPLLAATLGACSQMPFPQNRGQAALDMGLRQYEDGNYRDAAKTLQQALDLGLSDDDNRALARKHLAFIHCAAGREKPCREEFRKVFEMFPKYELSAAEAGHPAWGPVFRGVKSEQAKKR
jgi:Tfp pilus assembly protein PilF